MITPRPIDAQSAAFDAKMLNDLRAAGASEEGRKDALKSAAKQLETMFLNLMLKSMRQANQALSDGESIDGKDAEMFKDMLDQQYAQAMSSGYGLGLADRIAEQLDPQRRRHAAQPSVDADGRPAGFSLQEGTAPQAYPAPERDMSLRGIDPSTFSLLRRPEKTKGPLADSQEDFVRTLLPHARKAGEALGIDPRAIIAQAALETGWGKHVMTDRDGKSSHNLFGIKAHNAWRGGKVSVETTEYRQNVAVREVANFRSYESLDHAFRDYVHFLQSDPRYSDALRDTEHAGQWGTHLQKAGYATDPAYGKKIADIVHSDELSKLTGN
jgi:flagellar protein FlgJ